jgi:hypothetical protein
MGVGLFDVKELVVRLRYLQTGIFAVLIVKNQHSLDDNKAQNDLLGEGSFLTF